MRLPLSLSPEIANWLYEVCAEGWVGLLLLLLLLLLPSSDPNVGLVLTKDATLGLTFSGTHGLEWYMSVWIILEVLYRFISTLRL